MRIQILTSLGVVACVVLFTVQRPSSADDVSTAMRSEEVRASLIAREPGCLLTAGIALASGEADLVRAALDGLADYGSSEARAVLELALEAFPRESRIAVDAKHAWATSFIAEHGDRASNLAQQAATDASLEPRERALHLVTLSVAEPSHARSVYRPFLDDPAPELLHAALMVNGAVWDYDVLSGLHALEAHADPAIRGAARQLGRRYLIWGPTRPTWVERQQGNAPDFEPHDRAGLRAWRARGDAPAPPDTAAAAD